jgi:phosphate ABC transporter phosphate-binding protein
MLTSEWSADGKRGSGSPAPGSAARPVRLGRAILRLLTVAMAVLAAVCTGLAATVLPAAATPPYPGVLTGGGSTWVYPAMSQWIADVAQDGMSVSYTPTGSSVGRTYFAQGIYDFAASDIPYGVTDGTAQDPPPTRGYAYVPDLAGATTFVYNLTVNGQRITDLRLSGSVLAQIFTGVITNWDDPQIAADDPGLNLPSIPITPVVRSDGDGSTADFTAWMVATQDSWWTRYCALPQISWNPCTATSTYPVGSDPAMKAEPGDGGVAGFVAQPQSNGAIGYTQYAYAIEDGFPVAKVLNTAGYYTEPTPGNVGVSLLAAQINTDASSPLYGTADLSGVYTDTDPRTYELSSYSYLIVPTDTSDNFTTAKGNTLGDFGQYLLCQGQDEVDALGYSALPINLVEAGYAQLAKIPGATVPTATTAILQGCDNPTFSTNGTNTLADTDPYPPACDMQGPTMCTTATGGAPGSGADVEPLTIAVPQTGSFSLTVPAGTVNLSVAGQTAAGALNPITVADTRNSYPGWSVSGQESSFAGSGTAAGSTIPGNQLGWTPIAITLGGGANLGAPVGPADPGMGTTPATLAYAEAGSGYGTSTLGANLYLAIPPTAAAGPYLGTLTVTAVTTYP